MCWKARGEQSLAERCRREGIDALYVAFDPEHVTGITEGAVAEAGLFGSYARALGWKKGREGGADRDPTHRLRQASLTAMPTGPRSTAP